MTASNGAQQSHTGEIGEIVATLRKAGDDHSPSVREIVEHLGQASFGAMLLVPAMIVATPASGLPGLSSTGGLIIALIACQMIVGRKHVWLPAWLMDRRIDSDRFDRALDFLRRPVRWVDHVTRARLTWVLRWPMVVPLHVLCVLCGLAMSLFELVPFSSSIAAVAVCIIAVAIIADDGVLALLGVAVALAGAVSFIGLAGSILSGIFG